MAGEEMSLQQHITWPLRGRHVSGNALVTQPQVFWQRKVDPRQFVLQLAYVGHELGGFEFRLVGAGAYFDLSRQDLYPVSKIDDSELVPVQIYSRVPLAWSIAQSIHDHGSVFAKGRFIAGQPDPHVFGPTANVLFVSSRQ
jgi:hypothetical protein